jgi:protein SCO1/2
MSRFVQFYLAWVALFSVGVSVAGAAANDPATAGVRYEQRNGQTLPLSVSFFEEQGQSHPLSAYFGTEPVVMIFGYFRCNQLCSVISDATIDALRQLRPEAVGHFHLLYVSIDPTDTVMAAHDAKTRDVRRFGRPDGEANWHYLTGQQASIEQLTRAAGFVYRYDEASKQYAHPSGFLIATSQGVISQYFLGVDFSEKDLATGMRRAAAGETGPTVFELLLLCFHGQGISGKYGVLIWRVLEVATATTVLGVATLIGYLLRDERRQRWARGGVR